jgi:serine/threonine-protein kinase RsbW
VSLAPDDGVWPASYTAGTRPEERHVATADPVHLILPADPRHLRLARLTAAGIAGDLGFDVERIEDLRVAVDELCAVLIDEAPVGARLSLEYRVADGEVRIQGELDVPAAELPEIHPVAAELLDIVADDYRVELVDGRRVFHLVKRGRDRAGDG